MKKDDPYIAKLGELWGWETGQNFLGTGRDEVSDKILRFRDPAQPGVILIKLPLGHVERVLKAKGYSLDQLKMEALG